ncbi:alpha/beta fold hydrolase [Chitinophaga tropicalis]|uniref:Alpha/beta fold hydrolase n=1 Tax=Chitinophaga tropicalis TaxID=2683588 RepID=A0A7K1U509_9BACT|nr:alpha/beta hydrolase [Chitinophaga tropicalis]MVT09075.1 alpha/beta fold hydrolase [Chitinophaga tropicalis]
MKKLTFITTTLLLFITLQSYSQKVQPVTSGFASNQGVKTYYEEYGKGSPLILLHGAYMTIGMNWNELIPELSKTHRVIALELQGHGHTPLTDRPLTWPTLAADVAAVMNHLKIDSADVIGYSFGGTVAYQLAIQNPEKVKRTVIISSTYKTYGWQKEVAAALRSMTPEMLTNTPLKTAYDAVAPDKTKWEPFLKQMIAFDNIDYNFGDDNIKKIKSPVLLISGDNDGVDKIELIKTYQLLGGCVFADMGAMPKSQLAIIPAQGHVSLMMQTKQLLEYITPFLK